MVEPRPDLPPALRELLGSAALADRARLYPWPAPDFAVAAAICALGCAHCFGWVHLRRGDHRVNADTRPLQCTHRISIRALSCMCPREGVLHARHTFCLDGVLVQMLIWLRGFFALRR